MSFKSKSRDISFYCYLLTLIKGKSNRKLLSGNEKYRDVPYGPPYLWATVGMFNKFESRKICVAGYQCDTSDFDFCIARTYQITHHGTLCHFTSAPSSN